MYWCRRRACSPHIASCNGSRARAPGPSAAGTGDRPGGGRPGAMGVWSTAADRAEPPGTNCDDRVRRPASLQAGGGRRDAEPPGSGGPRPGGGRPGAGVVNGPGRRPSARPGGRRPGRQAGEPGVAPAAAALTSATASWPTRRWWRRCGRWSACWTGRAGAGVAAPRGVGRMVPESASGGGRNPAGRGPAGPDAAVRAAARGAAPARRGRPGAAGRRGSALGRPVHPRPARVPGPEPARRGRPGADLPERRAPPPPSAAAVPGRAGPQRPGRAARAGAPGPPRPGRAAGRHPRGAGPAGPGRRDPGPLRGQPVLRRGAAGRPPGGTRCRALRDWCWPGRGPCPSRPGVWRWRRGRTRVDTSGWPRGRPGAGSWWAAARGRVRMSGGRRATGASVPPRARPGGRYDDLLRCSAAPARRLRRPWSGACEPARTVPGATAVEARRLAYNWYAAPTGQALCQRQGGQAAEAAWPWRGPWHYERAWSCGTRRPRRPPVAPGPGTCCTRADEAATCRLRRRAVALGRWPWTGRPAAEPLRPGPAGAAGPLPLDAAKPRAMPRRAGGGHHPARAALGELARRCRPSQVMLLGRHALARTAGRRRWPWPGRSAPGGGGHALTTLGTCLASSGNRGGHRRSGQGLRSPGS